MTAPNWLLIIALFGGIALLVIGGTWAWGKWHSKGGDGS